MGKCSAHVYLLTCCWKVNLICGKSLWQEQKLLLSFHIHTDTYSLLSHDVSLQRKELFITEMSVNFLYNNFSDACISHVHAFCFNKVYVEPRRNEMRISLNNQYILLLTLGFVAKQNRSLTGTRLTFLKDLFSFRLYHLWRPGWIVNCSKSKHRNKGLLKNSDLYSFVCTHQ